MILELLGVAAFGWWADRALSDEVTTGVKCNLCGWTYRHGPHPSVQEKAKADRMVQLHFEDAHPRLAEAGGAQQERLDR